MAGRHHPQPLALFLCEPLAQTSCGCWFHLQAGAQDEAWNSASWSNRKIFTEGKWSSLSRSHHWLAYIRSHALFGTNHITGDGGAWRLIRPAPKFSSVHSSHSLMSNSLWPHGLQYTTPPWPSPPSRVYSNSCPLSRWYHPTISSSVLPFFSCLQSFPASGSFLRSQFFTSGGQSIGVSASASVLPMNIQDWSPLGWTGWIFLQSKGLSRVFSSTTVQKHQFFSAQPCLWSTFTSMPDYWTNRSFD